MTNLDSLKENVYEMLQEHEAARNNDNYLILKIWERKGFIRISSIEYGLAKFLPSTESITRVRRKIQNEENIFPPTDPEVIKQRRIKQMKIEQWIKK